MGKASLVRLVLGAMDVFRAVRVLVDEDAARVFILRQTLEPSLALETGRSGAATGGKADVGAARIKSQKVAQVWSTWRERCKICLK